MEHNEGSYETSTDREYENKGKVKIPDKVPDVLLNRWEDSITKDVLKRERRLIHAEEEAF